jgi:hypothetical protein
MKRTASFVLGVALLLPHTVTGHHSVPSSIATSLSR